MDDGNLNRKCWSEKDLNIWLLDQVLFAGQGRLTHKWTWTILDAGQ